MGHQIRAFVGHPHVLARFSGVLPQATFHTLSAGAVLAVFSLDDDIQDALHHAYGTGEWLQSGLNLTDTDMAFAARASQAGPLAYVQTDYFGGAGGQCAALWVGGSLAIKPARLERDQAGNRPRATWPINAALRAVGVAARAGIDEFDAFGFGGYRSHDDIAQRALPVRG